MVIYLDGMIGLNFLVDLLLLLGVNRLSGFPPGYRRAAAGAAVGGGYAGICLIPGYQFLGSAVWRMASLGIMSMAAFGINASALRRGLLFVLLSMALGGLAVSFHAGHFLSLIGCAGLLALLCRIGIAGIGGRGKLMNVRLCYRGTEVNLTALRDTGNTLRDPITGESVLIAGCSVGCSLLGLHAEAFRDPVRAVEQHPSMGLRLIPYRAVGASSFMLGIRCDRVWIAGQEAGRIVAFSPEDFGTSDYQGLTGGQYG